MSVVKWLLSLNIQTILVFTAVFLLLFNYVRKQSWRGLPPGPPCLPLLGSLPFLGTSDLRVSLKALQKKYGDVFTVYVGHSRVVVLNSYDAIKDALQTNGQTFGARPPLFFVTHINKYRGKWKMFFGLAQ